MNYEEFPGGELRKRREDMGLTLEAVYLRIRIAPDYIKAMEEGDLRALPGATYAIGFIKSYCGLLELDPGPFLEVFRVSERLPQRRLAFTPVTEWRDRPSWVNEMLAWGTVVAIFLLGWVTYSVVVRPDPNHERSSAEADTIELSIPDDTAAPSRPAYPE